MDVKQNEIKQSVEEARKSDLNLKASLKSYLTQKGFKRICGLDLDKMQKTWESYLERNPTFVNKDYIFGNFGRYKNEYQLARRNDCDLNHALESVEPKEVELNYMAKYSGIGALIGSVVAPILFSLSPDISDDLPSYYLQLGLSVFIGITGGAWVGGVCGMLDCRGDKKGKYIETVFVENSLPNTLEKLVNELEK